MELTLAFFHFSRFHFYALDDRRSGGILCLKCVSVCLCICLCVCLSVRPDYKVKFFLTAPNQTVFIAGLPYLAHTFTISPPLHAHVPTVQGQDQGHLRTLDFG
jgi:hypothetical protein